MISVKSFEPRFQIPDFDPDADVSPERGLRERIAATNYTDYTDIIRVISVKSFEPRFQIPDFDPDTDSDPDADVSPERKLRERIAATNYTDYTDIIRVISVKSFEPRFQIPDFDPDADVSPERGPREQASATDYTDIIRVISVKFFEPRFQIPDFHPDTDSDPDADVSPERKLRERIAATNYTNYTNIISVISVKSVRSVARNDGHPLIPVRNQGLLREHLAAYAAYVVSVAFIVAEDIGPVEHDNPGTARVGGKCCRRPVA